ncbi:hypothetical protein [Arthrobacter sp. 18067]|uniref:hypothetical protein n=1 Tax=Arthrobacter sp. 18067 TaxID=2681413 RepID=UPI00135737B6|nr:hypothetical protein [Arthrobacter sp. 18067]
MAEQKNTKNPPNMGFLVLQEVAWLLGVTAMLFHTADRGFDWIWLGLLTAWQVTIIWGWVKLRRALRPQPSR